jgi:hypothetical protein
MSVRMFQYTAFAFGVPVDINAFYYYTEQFRIPLPVLKFDSIDSSPKLSPKIYHQLKKPPADALRPMNPDNV